MQNELKFSPVYDGGANLKEKDRKKLIFKNRNTSESVARTHFNSRKLSQEEKAQ